MAVKIPAAKKFVARFIANCFIYRKFERSKTDKSEKCGAAAGGRTIADLALGAHSTDEVLKISIDHHETFRRSFSAPTFESAAYPAPNASAELLFR